MLFLVANRQKHIFKFFVLEHFHHFASNTGTKNCVFTRIFVNQKTFFQYSALVIWISVTWFLWKSCKFECLHKGILLSQKHRNVAVCSFWRRYPMWLWMVPWNYVVLQLETPCKCVGNEVAQWINHSQLFNPDPAQGREQVWTAESRPVFFC